MTVFRLCSRAWRKGEVLIFGCRGRNIGSDRYGKPHFTSERYSTLIAPRRSRKLNIHVHHILAVMNGLPDDGGGLLGAGELLFSVQEVFPLLCGGFIAGQGGGCQDCPALALLEMGDKLLRDLPCIHDSLKGAEGIPRPVSRHRHRDQGRHAGTVALDSPPELLIINRPAYETILEHTAPEKSIKFDKMIVVENAETAIRMVRDGVGAGILSEYTMKTLAPDAPCYPVTPQITFDIGLFANDLRRLPPAAAELVRIIRRNAGILDG